MIRRLVHILVGLGITLLAVGGWLTISNSAQETPSDSPTQRQSTHTTSSPPAPTPSSTRQAPTTSSTPETTTNSSTTSPTSTTPTSKTATSTTPSPRSPRAERARAVETARAFLSDLTARERDPKRWWRAVEPHLSPQARMDMSGMEPGWIPPLELKPGGGVVVDEDAPMDAHQRELEVTVPTKSGWVEVTLRPTPGGEEYLVVRYNLPKGQ